MSSLRVAFYGDSYTLGTGASDESRRWSTIICTGRGWQEFNPSINGLGFVRNREKWDDVPTQVIANDPELLFITLGLNDNFAYDYAAAEIEKAIMDDFMRLRRELPKARIVVVEPFWYTDERPESVETIIGWVHDAAQAIAVEYIEGASHWIEGHPEWMADDGEHPNDEGYAELARRMHEALDELGL
jgi:lysophospholipase L1-like esterase